MEIPRCGPRHCIVSGIVSILNIRLRSCWRSLRSMTRTYSATNKLGRVLWWTVYTSLFRYSPRPLHGWRSFLLRCFGARLGSGCHIYASAKIWAPWNLECGPSACISNDAEIYTPTTVVLGEGAVVSQGAFLCAASHDYADPAFPLIHGGIVIGKKAWVGARAIGLMGVE